MEQKFLSYFNTGTKPESSNFDGTMQNLFTANFGGLTPVFAKPVLADDHFKISLNSEVKVATLTAPSYTNIKQNFYSFFVPNQTVWKHWNSFISNGTDFQDVYGSNMSNQSLDSPWKIPSIPTNYLQLITKIGKGFAVPVFTIDAADFEDTTALSNSFPMLASFLDISSYGANKYFVTKSAFNSRLGIYHSLGSRTAYVDSSLFFNACYSFEMANPSTEPTPQWKRIFDICPYLTTHWIVNSNIHIDKSVLFTGTNQGLAEIRFTSIEFGCSLDDLPELIQILTNNDNSVFNVDYTDGDLFNVRNNVYQQKFRFFCDEVNNDFNINESPFYYDNHSVNTFGCGHLNLNATTIRRKYTQNIDSNSNNVFGYGLGTLGSYKVIQDSFIKLSNFWAKELVLIQSLVSPYSKSVLLSVNENDGSCQFFMPESSDCYESYIASFESELFVPSLYYFTDDPYCHNYSNVKTTFSNNMFYHQPWAFSPDLYQGQTANTNRNIISGQSVYSYGLTSDVQLNFYCSTFEKLHDWPYPILLSSFNFQVDSDIFHDYINYIPYIDSTAVAAGMTTFTNFLYLTMSVCKTLDYFNVPFEGFTIRDFYPYGNEYINALPFFAYSKIWDEYFRNRTVSSPELDYRECNSLIYYNDPRKIYQSNNYTGDYEYFSELPLNGWVIPFDVLPKNSQDVIDFSLASDDSSHLLVNGINNFHYFQISCTSDWFNLLTGFQLGDTILHQVKNAVLTNHDPNNSHDYTLLLGAIINNFQLPSFYNGLLHYKYQNFSKDYFSSSLLDAMSGANEELIPDNVSELRSAEARQSFWEQTAVARSLKKFYDKMFGTSPTHIELCRPLLLGQSHTSISVGEIIQTSESGDTPQGTRSGIAGSHDVSGVCNHGFNEQGWLIILCSYTLDAQYFQGLSKHLTPYKSFLDYPFRQFYHIGNQSINMREVNYFSNPSKSLQLNTLLPSRFSDLAPINPYSKNSTALNPHRVVKNGSSFDLVPNYCVNSQNDFNAIFGYIPRFSEYKFNLDECHGDFRNTLDSWNTFRKFHTLPYLTHNFVNWEFSGQQFDLNRLFAVQDNSDKFLCSLYINCQMHRQIPYYTVPKSSVN